MVASRAGCSPDDLPSKARSGVLRRLTADETGIWRQRVTVEEMDAKPRKAAVGLTPGKETLMDPGRGRWRAFPRVDRVWSGPPRCIMWRTAELAARSGR